MDPIATKMRVRRAQVADARSIANVHVESWRTSFAGVVAPEYLASLSYEERENLWCDLLTSATSTVCVHVVETELEGIVGFVSAGPAREPKQQFQGEIYALYVLQSCQRQGLGSLLFRTSVEELKSRGMTSIMVWTLANSPFRKFYEAIGGQYVREKRITIGQQYLLQVAYGWIFSES